MKKVWGTCFKNIPMILHLCSFFDSPQAKICFCPVERKDNDDFSQRRHCNNLPNYCHLELCDFFTQHLLHDSQFEMPFTVCPNREPLFLSLMAGKLKLVHIRKGTSLLFLLFPKLYFGRSLDVRKYVGRISMYSSTIADKCFFQNKIIKICN